MYFRAKCTFYNLFAQCAMSKLPIKPSTLKTSHVSVDAIYALFLLYLRKV